MARSLPLLVVLIVGAIVINIMQFRTIDAGSMPNFAAVQRGETADLVEIAYHECPWCRDRYSLHFALRVVAPGSRVVVAVTEPFTMPRPWDDDHDAAEELAARLLTFGGAEEVDWLGPEWTEQVQDSAAPNLVAGVDPAPFVVATGEGGEKGAPWVLAVDQARLDDLDTPGVRGVTNPDRFLELALAEGEHRQSDRLPGEFVLLRWQLPRPGSEYSYQDLLLESSLLPEPVRRSL